MIQKEFKITPSYMEISEHDEDDWLSYGSFYLYRGEYSECGFC